MIWLDTQSTYRSQKPIVKPLVDILIGAVVVYESGKYNDRIIFFEGHDTSAWSWVKALV